MPLNKSRKLIPNTWVFKLCRAVISLPPSLPLVADILLLSQHPSWTQRYGQFFRGETWSETPVIQKQSFTCIWDFSFGFDFVHILFINRTLLEEIKILFTQWILPLPTQHACKIILEVICWNSLSFTAFMMWLNKHLPAETVTWGLYVSHAVLISDILQVLKR